MSLEQSCTYFIIFVCSRRRRVELKKREKKRKRKNTEEKDRKNKEKKIIKYGKTERRSGIIKE